MAAPRPYFGNGGWCPSITQKRKQELRMQKAQFGDGYQQRALDGINAIKTTYDLTFENRPEDEINAMVNYIVLRNGGAFPFCDRGYNNVEVNVWCDEWDVAWTMVKPGVPVKRYATLSCSFEIAFGVTVGVGAPIPPDPTEPGPPPDAPGFDLGLLTNSQLIALLDDF
jgi:phage-related protein